MTIEELLDMILEDIEGQGHIAYSDNRFAPIIIKNCKEIMQLANEGNISLYKKVSDDCQEISFAKNREDLPN